MTERITVSCSTSQDLHEWLDHLQRLTKGTCNTASKTHSWSAHSVSASPPQPPAAPAPAALPGLSVSAKPLVAEVVRPAVRHSFGCNPALVPFYMYPAPVLLQPGCLRGVHREFLSTPLCFSALFGG